MLLPCFQPLPLHGQCYGRYVLQESKILQEQSEGPKRWTSASTPQAKRGVVTDGPPSRAIPVTTTPLGTQSHYSIICYHTPQQMYIWIASCMLITFISFACSDYSHDCSVFDYHTRTVNRSCEVANANKGGFPCSHLYFTVIGLSVSRDVTHNWLTFNNNVDARLSRTTLFSLHRYVHTYVSIACPHTPRHATACLRTVGTVDGAATPDEQEENAVSFYVPTTTLAEVTKVLSSVAMRYPASL